MDEKKISEFRALVAAHKIETILILISVLKHDTLQIPHSKKDMLPQAGSLALVKVRAARLNDTQVSFVGARPVEGIMFDKAKEVLDLGVSTRNLVPPCFQSVTNKEALKQGLQKAFLLLGFKMQNRLCRMMCSQVMSKETKPFKTLFLIPLAAEDCAPGNGRPSKWIRAVDNESAIEYLLSQVHGCW